MTIGMTSVEPLSANEVHVMKAATGMVIHWIKYDRRLGGNGLVRRTPRTFSNNNTFTLSREMLEQALEKAYIAGMNRMYKVAQDVSAEHSRRYE